MQYFISTVREYRAYFCIPLIMERIELEIIALSHSMAKHSNYAVILGELEGPRRLPVVIGGFEAQAIAVSMEKMETQRPMTHDLMLNLLEHYGVELKEVVITDLNDGVFIAALYCVREGMIVEIDSRTSDALALAVRFGCPIYTYERIMDEAGIILDDETNEQVNEARQTQRKKPKKKSLADMTAVQLEKMLGTVLENEDYERAAKIRDELNRREEMS